MRGQLLAAEQIKALEWKDNALWLLDQRVLPLTQRWVECASAAQVTQAITEMVVRGAPAIGIAAAFAVVLAARQRSQESPTDWRETINSDLQQLAASRPTAVNLFWAIKRMQTVMAQSVTSSTSAKPVTLTDLLVRLEQAALDIYHSDREANLVMAQLGKEVIEHHCEAPQHVLTHCNAGALATGGFGTALGVVRAAHLAGLIGHVHVDETRPWLQGSRLTAWELARDNIPFTVNADSTAAHLMREGDITWVIVGADRITANGDVANKIGTYQLAVLARFHEVRLMVVAPSSTIDMQLRSGADIVIEERTADELFTVAGTPIVEPVPAFNPVFDVTPASLVDVIVTERGVVKEPTLEKMQQLMNPVGLH